MAPPHHRPTARRPFGYRQNEQRPLLEILDDRRQADVAGAPAVERRLNSGFEFNLDVPLALRETSYALNGDRRPANDDDNRRGSGESASVGFAVGTSPSGGLQNRANLVPGMEGVESEGLGEGHGATPPPHPESWEVQDTEGQERELNELVGFGGLPSNEPVPERQPEPKVAAAETAESRLELNIKSDVESPIELPREPPKAKLPPVEQAVELSGQLEIAKSGLVVASKRMGSARAQVLRRRALRTGRKLAQVSLERARKSAPLLAATKRALRSWDQSELSLFTREFKSKSDPIPSPTNSPSLFPSSPFLLPSTTTPSWRWRPTTLSAFSWHGSRPN
jgi:hypothetical protein